MEQIPREFILLLFVQRANDNKVMRHKEILLFLHFIVADLGMYLLGLVLVICMTTDLDLSLCCVGRGPWQIAPYLCVSVPLPAGWAQ